MVEKLCECGCGQPASKRFIHGHNSREEHNNNWRGGRTTESAHGYVFIRSPEHPRASNGGYVPEHILVVEKALGRYLPKGAVVHHINERGGENRNDNLVICQDHAYHQILHRRMRALRATGNPNARKCKFCKEYEIDLSTGTLSKSTFRHRSCDNANCKERRKKRKLNSLKGEQ